MGISKEEFEKFRIKFGMELSERALSCDRLSEDSEAKDFVSKFVIENIINKETSNEIQNIVYKLANMRIANYALSKEKGMIEFPIINKYIGNELVGSYFFEKTIENKIQEVFIEVRPSPLIIL